MVALQRHDFRRLEAILAHAPARQGGAVSQTMYRARVHAAFQRGDFKQVYQVLESQPFDARYHTELQHLWYQSRYAEQRRLRNKPLGKAAGGDRGRPSTAAPVAWGRGRG